MEEKIRLARLKGYEGDPCQRVRPADAGPQRRLLQVRHLRGDLGLQLR